MSKQGEKPLFRWLYGLFTICCLISAGLFLFGCLSGCATLTEQEKKDRLAAIHAFADQTIEKMIRGNPTLNAEYEAAPGYAIFNLDTTKIPYVGYGNGQGLLVDKKNKEPFYLKVKVRALGSGLGAKRYRILVLFEDKKAMDAFRAGKIKIGAGADLDARAEDLDGDAVEAKITSQKGFTSYMFTDTGVTATLTLWMISVSLDKNLN